MLLDGNYTDTANARAERRSRPEAEERAAPRAKPPSQGKRATSTEDREAARRRRRITALEEKIAAREGEIETLENRLWEEGLTLGPTEANRLAQEKAKRREELEALVEEWAKLSQEEAPAGSTTAR